MTTPTIQATVETWDDNVGARLIRDDGTMLVAAAAAVAAGGFRFLRTGQRVVVESDDHGTVRLVRPVGEGT